MRAIVTGITGFAGSHLAEHLLEEGFEVWGLTKPGSPTENLNEIKDRVVLEEAELQTIPLTESFARAQPDFVFHLAGQAHVAAAWRDREETFRVNTMGTGAVLDAALALSRAPRVLLISSGEIYGRHGSPFSENSPAHPETPYALSKLMAEEIAVAYARWDELPISIARAFNHTGPRQAPTFVCSQFAHDLAAIRLGQREPRLPVGNLEARRDFSDVRDTVKGYRRILMEGSPGRVYNICSGRGVSIQSILDRLIEIAGGPVEVVEDSTKFRPLDCPELVGDGQRARDEIGFTPEIPLERTLEDLFRFWLDRLG